MLLSAVSVLVVAQSSSEVPDGLMNNPVFAAQEKFYTLNNSFVLSRSFPFFPPHFLRSSSQSNVKTIGFSNKQTQFTGSSLR